MGGHAAASVDPESQPIAGHPGVTRTSLFKDDDDTSSLSSGGSSHHYDSMDYSTLRKATQNYMDSPFGAVLPNFNRFCGEDDARMKLMRAFCTTGYEYENGKLGGAKLQH